MKLSKRKLKRVSNYILKNKFWLTIVLFLFWIVVLDQNNIFQLLTYDRDINDLKNQKEYLNNKIIEDSTKLYELRTDDKSLEKFAREEYFMHKSNEEVFVIKEVE